MMLFPRLAIIGVGLIGGSLARAARAAGVVGEIVGSGRDERELQRAVTLGVIDRYVLDAAAAVHDADLVVLAVPLGAMESVLRSIASALATGTVITDVGSTKASVLAAARAVFGIIPPHFVPGHPIAGTEKSGVAASFAELFYGRRVILTPQENTDPLALARVRALWQATGAEVVDMEASHHDQVLAATSHLPHILAYALVDTLLHLDASADIFRYAAGGFRDFTRIASSHPEMWRDICLANREAILNVLDRYRAELATVDDCLRQADGAGLLRVFIQAKTARDQYSDRWPKSDDVQSPFPC